MPRDRRVQRYSASSLSQHVFTNFLGLLRDIMPSALGGMKASDHKKKEKVPRLLYEIAAANHSPPGGKSRRGSVPLRSRGAGEVTVARCPASVCKA